MINVLYDTDKETTTLEIENFFNMYNVKEVDAIWKQELKKNPKIIIIDCITINSIDSPAIGMLVKFKNEANNNQVELILDNVPARLLNVFKTTNLVRFFCIRSSVGI